MENFTNDQLHILTSALQDFATKQLEIAKTWKSDPELREARNALKKKNGFGIVEETERSARTAERLRSAAAAELHKRGKTSCDLAHPGTPECSQPFSRNAH